MAIKCGGCKNYHDSVDEVRDCFAGARDFANQAASEIAIERHLESQGEDDPRERELQAFESQFRSGPPVQRTNAPTEKQIRLIEQLLEERVHGLTLTADACRNMGKSRASQLIDELFHAPKRAATTTATPTLVANTSPTHTVPNGTYTVVLGEDDDYVTLKFETASWADGKTTVSFLSGSDNTCSYTGFAFLTDRGLDVWRRYRDESRPVAAAQFLLTGDVDAAHERFLKNAEAYALESGRCMRCFKTLTVPASLHRGLGPVCAGIEGV